MGNVSCIGNNCVIDAVDSLSATATTAFNAFANEIVPLILGALVFVSGLSIARYVIRRATKL